MVLLLYLEMIKKKVDVLVLGGGPGGIKVANIAKRKNPDKSVLIMNSHKENVIPCALPYAFGSEIGSVEKITMPCGGSSDNYGVETIIDTAYKLDRKNKIVYAENHEIKYDKLVFATGSIPFIPENLCKSLALDSVFVIEKEYSKALELEKSLVDKQNVVIIGSGFIGVEFAEQLAKKGKKVTLVGGKHILSGSFDEDMSIQAEEVIKNLGVNLTFDKKAIDIRKKDNQVIEVELSDGTFLEADIVIIATGYQSNTKIAKDAGIKLSRHGAIWVDYNMRTKYDNDIFAVGDCARKTDFATRRLTLVLLASTAIAEARVAGSSLYNLDIDTGFKGTIAIFSTKLGDIAFASAGITVTRAKEEGIDCIVGVSEGVNRHPGSITDTSIQKVKLIVASASGKIIGGQIIGGTETGELINTIGQAIENGLTVHDISKSQVATHPLLTPSPLKYALIIAAEEIIFKQK